MTTLRLASRADAAALNAIYEPYVRSSTCTMQLEPDTLEWRENWLDAHGDAHPVVVIEDGGEVIAWGALSPYAERPGYRFSVEDSIYVREDRRGRGLGKRLLGELVERARQCGHHAIVAKITADQPASLALHAAFGFVDVARLPEIGFKLGRWVDVVFLQLMLRGP